MHLCDLLLEVSRAESSASTEVPKTKGELEKIHGESETADLLARGFFEKIVIKGVDHYIKQAYEKRQTMSKTTEETMHLQKSVAAEEVATLEGSFDSWKCSLDLDFKTSWKGSSNSSGNNNKDLDLPAASTDSKAQSKQPT